MATQHNYSHSDRSAVDGDSAALVRSSDEEQATSSARREGSQEPTPTPRLSLTSLPTEILRNIVSQVPYDWYRKKVDQVLVARRFFEIAYPFWVRKIALTEEKRDVVLAGLARRAVPYVKHLTGTFISSLPRLQCSVFDHLPNLTHLDIGFTDETVDVLPPMPERFFDALRRLRHLVSLNIDYDKRDEPRRDFSFAEDVPSLRELDIDARDSLADCAPGLSRLERLRLHTFDSVASGIPWETLLHLDIECSQDEFLQDDSYSRDFVAHLRATCQNSAIPLRSLALSVWRRESPGLGNLMEILEVLRAPRLEEVVVYGIRTFAGWTSGPPLQSVQRLTLRGDCQVVSMDASNLQAVLALFPAVKVLHLEKLNYQHQDHTLYALYHNAKEPILRAICNNNLLIQFPAITAMLSFVVHTNVLRLRLSTSDKDGITWSRSSRSESFEAEGWRII